MKFTIGILLTTLLLTGCGISQSSEHKNSLKNGEDNKSSIFEDGMTATLKEIAPLHYQYQVLNQTNDPITLKFTSSQRIDYSITTKSGEEIFLFSSTAAFLSALGKEEILPEEDFLYDIHLADLRLNKGEYTLSAWMTPKEGKMYKVSTVIHID
ncbi:MAG TPA: BsuPI-related putative proteinase inhibitor [Metabacillus sp.]|nr:BsuPI-related putative proteinase inhibitor [Metabacillus sp.]